MLRKVNAAMNYKKLFGNMFCGTVFYVVFSPELLSQTLLYILFNCKNQDKTCNKLAWTVVSYFFCVKFAQK